MAIFLYLASAVVEASMTCRAIERRRRGRAIAQQHDTYRMLAGRDDEDRRG